MPGEDLPATPEPAPAETPGSDEADSAAPELEPVRESETMSRLRAGVREANRRRSL